MKNVKLKARIDLFVAEAHYRDIDGAIIGPVYFTECPMYFEEEYYGYRYYFCCQLTNKTLFAFNKQAELSDWLIRLGY